MSRISRGRRLLLQQLRERRDKANAPSSAAPAVKKGEWPWIVKTCESLVTPYVDGEVTPDQCAAIEAHLSDLPRLPRVRRSRVGRARRRRRCRVSLRALGAGVAPREMPKLAAEHTGDAAGSSQEQVAASQGLPFDFVSIAVARDWRPRSDWRWWAPCRSPPR